jgi:hypothetical protein
VFTKAFTKSVVDKEEIVVIDLEGRIVAGVEYIYRASLLYLPENTCVSVDIDFCQPVDS